MKVKTYFIHFLVTSLIASILALVVGILLLNQKKEVPKAERADKIEAKAPSTSENADVMEAEKKVADSFVQAYFTFSSTNYKDRLTKLKPLTTDVFYQDLVRTFDDVLIEKGQENKLEKYSLYQSPDDDESLFVTLRLMITVGGVEQPQNQTAVLRFERKNNQLRISDLKFIQIPEV